MMLAAVVAAALRPAGWSGTQTLGLGMVALAPLWLAAAAWLWRRPRRIALRWILLFSLLFRLGAALEPPALSSDAYRYLWDGRVQRSGTSPYAFAPGDAHLQHLRDGAVFPKVNRPEARTIYPPGAQVLFAALPFDLGAARLLFIALDLLTVWLIAQLLAQVGHDPARALLYGWSPLAIYEVGNASHLDAAMLPLLVGGAWALVAGRARLAGWLWGGAASLKLYPALAALAPIPEHRRSVDTRVLFVAAGLYGAYGVVSGTQVLGFLPDYVRAAEDHNIGMRAVFEALGAPLGPAGARLAGFGACIVVMAVGVWLVLRQTQDPLRRLRDLIAVYLLTVPTALHPWYALWLLPFLCTGPTAAGLWLLATLPLSYLKYSAPGGVLPQWVPVVEFLPATLLQARLLWRAPRVAT
ncbi:MAG: DUF2029 domain-containing protein [Deltaproteobacteria bacterium]|nr:DUF2029 domain-containing protein [Deltaproteobacteria bacterium]